MSTTFKVNFINNTTSHTCTFYTADNPSETTTAAAHSNSVTIGLTVPSATSASEYEENHMVVELDTIPGKFTFWDNNGSLYYSQTDTWNDTQHMATQGIQRSGEVNHLYLKVEVQANQTWVIGEFEIVLDEEEETNA